MSELVSPTQIAASLTELWSPRVIGELDDSYIKVAKVKGTFGWHDHADEDELFFILSGHLRIELRDAVRELDAGQMIVIPKGVQHNPVAAEECLIMLIEKKSTLHAGETANPHARSIEEQLRDI